MESRPFIMALTGPIELIKSNNINEIQTFLQNYMPCIYDVHLRIHHPRTPRNIKKLLTLYYALISEDLHNFFDQECQQRGINNFLLIASRGYLPLLKRKQSQLQAVINTYSGHDFNTLSYVLHDPNNINLVVFLIENGIIIDSRSLNTIKSYSESLLNPKLKDRYRVLYRQLLLESKSLFSLLSDDLLMMVTDHPEEIDKLCQSGKDLIRRICLHPNAEFWRNIYKKKTGKYPTYNVNLSYKDQYKMLFGGKIYTSGCGNFGELGHGKDVKRLYQSIPTKDFSHNDRQPFDYVSAISSGPKHTAFIKDGKIYTYGDASYGKLGRECYKNNNWVAYAIDGFSNVTAVSSGGDHTAFIQNGMLYTFGCGEKGQLGHGDRSDLHVPMAIAGFNNVDAVSSGGNHTAFIQDGKLYTFGNNFYGQLGHGDTTNLNIPVQVKGYGNVSAVSCGANHTAFIQNGRVYTFGKNDYGQLGHDRTDMFAYDDAEILTVPMEIQGHSIDHRAFNKVSVISCGRDHSAFIQNGRVYTFGNGEDGQLGHRNDKSCTIPTVIIKNYYGQQWDKVTDVSCGYGGTAFVHNNKLYFIGLSLQLKMDPYDNLKRDDNYNIPCVESMYDKVISVSAGKTTMAFISL